MWVENQYVRDSQTYKYLYLVVMFFGMMYPLLYDSYQLKWMGWRKYFESFWNYFDFTFIWLGVINILL